MFDNNPFREFKKMMKNRINEQNNRKPANQAEMEALADMTGAQKSGEFKFWANPDALASKPPETPRSQNIDPNPHKKKPKKREEIVQKPIKDEKFEKHVKPKPQDPKQFTIESKIERLFKMLEAKEYAPGGGGTTREQDSGIQRKPAKHAAPEEMGPSDWNADRDAWDAMGQRIGMPKPKSTLPPAVKSKPETEEEKKERLRKEEQAEIEQLEIDNIRADKGS